MQVRDRDVVTARWRATEKQEQGHSLSSKATRDRCWGRQTTGRDSIMRNADATALARWSAGNEASASGTGMDVRTVFDETQGWYYGKDGDRKEGATCST